MESGRITHTGAANAPSPDWTVLLLAERGSGDKTSRSEEVTGKKSSASSDFYLGYIDDFIFGLLCYIHRHTFDFYT